LGINDADQEMLSVAPRPLLEKRIAALRQREPKSGWETKEDAIFLSEKIKKARNRFSQIETFFL